MARDSIQNTYYTQQATALPGDLYAAQSSQNVISALWYDETGEEILRPGEGVLLIPSASPHVPSGLTGFARGGLDFVAIPLSAYDDENSQVGIVVRNQVGGNTRFDGSSDSLNRIPSGSMIDVLRVEQSAQIYMRAYEGVFQPGQRTLYINSVGSPGDAGRLSVTDLGDGYPIKAEILDSITITSVNKEDVSVPVRFLNIVGV
jgi:hypothetical protein